MIADEAGFVTCQLVNEELGIGVQVRCLKSDFLYFCEWKMLGKGECVLGLEPLISPLDGPKLENLIFVAMSCFLRLIENTKFRFIILTTNLIAKQK